MEEILKELIEEAKKYKNAREFYKNILGGQALEYIDRLKDMKEEDKKIIIITDIWGKTYTHNFKNFEDAVKWAQKKFVKDVRKIEEYDRDGKLIRRRYI
jgi:DNA polymerase III delta prime subunit